MQESKVRSLLKAISWRIVASLITGSIVFVVTGKGLLALSVGVIDSVIKILVYYFHERIWWLIPLGKPSHPLADLEVTKELTDEDKSIIRKKLQDLGYLED